MPGGRRFWRGCSSSSLWGGTFAMAGSPSRKGKKGRPPCLPPSRKRSDVFSYSGVEGQRTIYTIRASRTTQFKEGSRNLLEDVSISVFGKKGDRNDTLRTRACDFISDTKKITCAGEVQIILEAKGADSA